MPEVQDTVFLDGTQDWIAPSASESRASPTLEIPVVDFDMQAILIVPAEVMAYPSYFQIDIRQYENADDPWGASGSSRIVLMPQILGTQYMHPDYSPPCEVIVPIHPTKPHIRMAIASVLEGVNWGKVTFKLRYEVMATTVYDFLMEIKGRNEAAIDSAQVEVDLHHQRHLDTLYRRNMHQGRRQLYDNFLSEEIEQYELLTGGE